MEIWVCFGKVFDADKIPIRVLNALVSTPAPHRHPLHSRGLVSTPAPHVARRDLQVGARLALPPPLLHARVAALTRGVGLFRLELLAPRVDVPAAVRRRGWLTENHPHGSLLWSPPHRAIVTPPPPPFMAPPIARLSPHHHTP